MGRIMTAPIEPTRDPQPVTRPPITTVEVFGLHVPASEITATYTAAVDYWTDMPEARPRARCRVRPSVKAGADVRVVCLTDGSVRFDSRAVDLDVYPGAGYASIRAEGEARWAALDAAAGL
jgi:hypothetical protein